MRGWPFPGDRTLERAAATGLHTRAEQQAPKGQIPKFVDVQRSEADFWYLGCIDSTLWWLIGLDCLGLRRCYTRRIQLALQWLLAQEHQRGSCCSSRTRRSDWADIMPRSGFVLYTNTLWYLVKRIYGLGDLQATRASFNGLFHPFSSGLAEYRRARLLNDYVLSVARAITDLYLSFVNFCFLRGEEGRCVR